MKKVTPILIQLLFASSILTSCGSDSIESDAKKVAQLQCEAQKLMKEATSGDMSIVEKSTKLVTEAATLSREMEGKYTSDSDKKKFSEALLREMGKCD